MALDLDTLKHSLGAWSERRSESGLRARALGLALIDAQLEVGGDVILGQYLGGIDFIEELARRADEKGAAFHEFLLDTSPEVVEARLRARRDRPTRPEQTANDASFALDEVPEMGERARSVARLRPATVVIDASGSVDSVLAQIRGRLGGLVHPSHLDRG